MLRVTDLGEAGEDAGGKASSLGSMLRMGLPVPRGFVVHANALDEWPPDLDDEILTRFRSLGAPRVAVRSSAAAEDGTTSSWAGQLQTFLNVTEDDLLDHIARCRDSIRSAHALAYREHAGSGGGVAVVVQEMVHGDVSGVLFTIHPVTANRDEIVLEAVLGLGEALVGGAITPDRYVVSKEPFAILERSVANQTRALFPSSAGGVEWRDIDGGERQKLTDEQIAALVAYAMQLEREWRRPVDVEWAVRDGAVSLLQCRPVTAVPREPAESWWFSWGENCTIVTAELWMRIYTTPRDVPGSDVSRALIFIEDGALSLYLHESEGARAAAAGLRLLDPEFVDAFLRDAAATREEFERFRRDVVSQDLRHADGATLASLLERYVELHANVSAYSNFTQPEYLEPAVLRLKERLRAHGFDGDALEAAFITITTPFEPDEIRLEEHDALELSLQPELDAALLARHAERHPWLFAFTYDRAVMESFLRTRIDDLRARPEHERRAALAEFGASDERKRRQCDDVLAATRGDEEVAALARAFRLLAVDRLRIKSYEAGAEFIFLPLFEAIAARARLPVRELLLTHRLSELLAICEGRPALDESIGTRRRDAMALLLEDGVLQFSDGHNARALFESHIPPAVSDDATTVITGTPANTGRARGPVRIVRSEGAERLMEDLARFETGAVLVATMTQPTMLSLARRAAAIVTDEGGITSHASILARELGIPCIVGTGRATRVLADGDLVDVDANRGVVTRLEEPS